MKCTTVLWILITIIATALPVHATQTAVIPAYAYVSPFQSSMKQYQYFMAKQNRAAARKLVNSNKIFLSPRDVKVEVVTFDEKVVKVKLNRLNENAEPIAVYFWTLADQLKMLPQN